MREWEDRLARRSPGSVIRTEGMWRSKWKLGEGKGLTGSTSSDRKFRETLALRNNIRHSAKVYIHCLNLTLQLGSVAALVFLSTNGETEVWRNKHFAQDSAQVSDGQGVNFNLGVLTPELWLLILSHSSRSFSDCPPDHLPRLTGFRVERYVLCGSVNRFLSD